MRKAIVILESFTLVSLSHLIIETNCENSKVSSTFNNFNVVYLSKLIAIINFQSTSIVIMFSCIKEFIFNYISVRFKFK